MLIKLKRQTKKVLCIDISTYYKSIPDIHKVVFEKNLRLRKRLWEEKTGRTMKRPALNYSRGLLTLAACLIKDGFDVKYLIHADHSDRKKIEDSVRDADVVCISALTPTISTALSICKNIKKINNNVVTIIGGPHTTALAVDTLKNCREVDFILIGESETRLPKLLHNLHTPDIVGGVVFRDENQIQISNTKIEPINVYEIPLPAYTLLSRPLSEYAHNIKTYRGCPYKCNFCAERVSWSGSHLSEASPKAVVEEIQFLGENVKPGSLIHFSDAIFTLRWGRVQEILDYLTKLDNDIVYSFDTRVDLITEEQILHLNRANFLYCRMGFESLHNEILDISQKSIAVERQLQASKMIRSAAKNTAIHAYMITGMPGSTRQSSLLDAESVHDLVANEVVDIVGTSIFVPYPDTPFFNTPSLYGIKLKLANWSEYDRRSLPVYDLDHLTANEIFADFLFQEMLLGRAYLRRLGDKNGATVNETEGLDYAYRNYVDKIAN